MKSAQIINRVTRLILFLNCLTKISLQVPLKPSEGSGICALIGDGGKKEIVLY